MLRFLMTLLPMIAGAEPAEDVVARFQSGSLTYTGGPYTEQTFAYRWLAPAAVEPGKKYPLVLFLHGAGERGDDNRKQLLYLPTWMSESPYREKFPCYLLAPQCPSGKWWMSIGRRNADEPAQEAPTAEPHELLAVEKILDELVAREPIDPERIYLTGLSMGGFGSWALAARQPERFAAMVPICGGGNPKQANRLAKLPIWAVHGEADPVVPVRLSRMMVEAVKQAGGTIEYTELAGVKHDSWTPAYQDPEGVLAWMFRQRRTGGTSP